MSKTTQNLVIGIGIASILFAVYGVFRGRELMDAASGITIGAALIGTIIIENRKKK